MVASLSEEVVNPSRNMPIGIVGSLVASTLIYVVVSLSVVGMAKFEYLGETVPIVNALMVNACCSHFEQDEYIAHDQTSVCLKECQFYQKPLLATAAHLVSVGAILGLQAACFTSLMGQPRIVRRHLNINSFFALWIPFFMAFLTKFSNFSLDTVLQNGKRWTVVSNLCKNQP
jgi:amino acid transporter